MDADANAYMNANADAGGSTIALSERCSGELIIAIKDCQAISEFVKRKHGAVLLEI